MTKGPKVGLGEHCSDPGRSGQDAENSLLVTRMVTEANTVIIKEGGGHGHNRRIRNSFLPCVPAGGLSPGSRVTSSCCICRWTEGRSARQAGEEGKT